MRTSSSRRYGSSIAPYRPHFSDRFYSIASPCESQDLVATCSGLPVSNCKLSTSNQRNPVPCKKKQKRIDAKPIIRSHEPFRNLPIHVSSNSSSSSTRLLNRSRVVNLPLTERSTRNMVVVEVAFNSKRRNGALVDSPRYLSDALNSQFFAS